MDFKEKIEFERQKIADKILERIQNNELEWSAGWHRFSDYPQNAKTGKKYNGTNLVILYFEGLEKGYTDPRWLTFNQAKELGAQVKAGEKATTVFHWNEYDKLTKTVPDWKEINKLPLEEKLRYCADNIRYSVSYHNVFNAEQCNGLEKFVAPTLSAEEMQKQNEKIERVIAASAAPVLYDGGSRAFYNFKEDKIHLPKIENFMTKEDYYATALHEIAHSTGHESRLNRGLVGAMDSKEYAIEELRAEFASLFMQSELELNIDAKHFDNHSAYIQGWSEAIRKDKNVLFAAIKDAGDIATYVRENYAEKENTKKNEGEAMEIEQAKTEEVDKNKFNTSLNLKVYKNTKDAVLVKLEIPGQETLKDVWLPKEQVLVSNKTGNVFGMRNDLYAKYREYIIEDSYQKQAKFFGTTPNEIKSAREKTAIEPLQIHHATEKAVLVKLAIAGQENLKDTWFPKYRVRLDEKGENVVAIDSYLQKQYGNVLSKQAEIKAAAVGKSVTKEPKPEKVEEQKEPRKNEKIEIEPLEVFRSTDKAVLVKVANVNVPNNPNRPKSEQTEDKYGLKDAWLPKSKIILDEKGENVVAVDYFLVKEYGDNLTKQDSVKLGLVQELVGKAEQGIKELKDSQSKIAGQPVSSGMELAQKLNAQRLANLEKNVPDEMKALPNWAVLKIYKDKESGAYKKFIINANNPDGGWASHKDSTTWTTFDKALEYAKAHNGAGLSFAIKGSGFNAFDIDHCYDKESKTYNETAQKYLTALPNSYAERSVSGTGLHILTKSQVCENGKYNEARGGAEVEVFETWGFISMTGNIVDEQHKSLVELPENLKKDIQNQIGEKKVFQAQTQPNRNQYHNYAKSDSEVIEVIRKSKKADEFNSLMNGAVLWGDHSKTDLKLMNILAYFTNSNIPQMQSIFKQSKLYRPKKSDSYYERTAKLAANSLNQRAQ